MVNVQTKESKTDPFRKGSTICLSKMVHNNNLCPLLPKYINPKGGFDKKPPLLLLNGFMLFKNLFFPALMALPSTPRLYRND